MMEHTLPLLLGLAWLAPLASFALILFFGPRMGKAGHGAGYLATAAIVAAFVLSAIALGCWASERPIPPVHHGAAAHEPTEPIEPVHGDWYALGVFGSFQVTIGYYIDGLTLAMFCMVRAPCLPGARAGPASWEA